MPPRSQTPLPLSKTPARRLWLHAQRLDEAAPFDDGPNATRPGTQLPQKRNFPSRGRAAGRAVKTDTRLRVGAIDPLQEVPERIGERTISKQCVDFFILMEL
jgi:hypothetical protein